MKQPPPSEERRFASSFPPKARVEVQLPSVMIDDARHVSLQPFAVDVVETTTDEPTSITPARPQQAVALSVGAGVLGLGLGIAIAAAGVKLAVAPANAKGVIVVVPREASSVAARLGVVERPEAVLEKVGAPKH